VDNSTRDEIEVDFGVDDFSRSRTAKHPTIATKVTPLGNYTQRLTQEANIDMSNLSTQKHNDKVPPWLLPTPSCRYDYAGVSKKQNPLYVSNLARELLATDYSQHLHIFTDGSKLESGKVGCAFHIPAFPITKTFRLDDGISIMSAELFAINMALAYVRDFPHQLIRVVIVTDSKSSLQALENPSSNREDLLLECLFTLRQLQEKGTEVRFLWVPSHTDILGNTVVDGAAKVAAGQPFITNNIGLTKTELSKKIKHAALHSWKADYNASAAGRSWPSCDRIAYVAPDSLPSLELALFHRLTTGYLKFHVVPAVCICGQLLTCQHVFDCRSIIPTFTDTITLMQTFGIQLNRVALLSQHP
jgi:ribonuclease HI